jgi:hypothetical protein
VDRDNDGYGTGCPRGPDCDDGDRDQTGVEICDGRDNDCDGIADNGVLTACGDCVATCTSAGIGRGTGIGFRPGEDGVDSEGVGTDETGALILDSRAINTKVIWIANTSDGTVSKVDTDTFVELGRYVTGPAGRGNDPSRTTVNSLGDVYVVNRGGRTVTKISVLGSDCPDRNGDGVVNTSTGPTDVKPWGEDECVLWNTSLPDGGLLRAGAAQDLIGPDGEVFPYVWIGGWDSVLWKLDGETGAVILRAESPVRNYGFALDGLGNLWISGRDSSPPSLGRVDTRRCIDDASCAVATCEGESPAADACIKQKVPTPGGTNTYGITVDFAQRVWVASYHGGGNRVMRYDPAAAAGSRWRTTDVGFNMHGIGADGSGFVWVAGYGNGVVRIDADSLAWRIVAGTAGPNAKGIAVDQSGKVWAINQGGANDATVIVPGPTLDTATVMTGVSPGPSMRYTYSDMTGTQLRLATNPFGWYRHVFEGCAMASETTEWRGLSWVADTPPGTSLRFRVRTAATRAELPSAAWVLVASVPPDTSPRSIQAALEGAGVHPQRFLEVEVRLEAMRTSTMRLVTPRVVSIDASHVCIPPFG